MFTYHFSQGAVAVCGLPFYAEFFDERAFEQYKRNNDAIKKELKNLAAYLNALKFPHVIAITANKYQQLSVNVLKENEFRPVVTFYSSHYGRRETLTLWTKTNVKFLENFPSVSPNAASYGSNCTVSFERKDDKNIKFGEKFCHIITESPGDTFESLKASGYKKVKNTPIWFHINEENIVKDAAK